MIEHDQLLAFPQVPPPPNARVNALVNLLGIAVDKTIIQPVCFGMSDWYIRTRLHILAHILHITRSFVSLVERYGVPQEAPCV